MYHKTALPLAFFLGLAFGIITYVMVQRLLPEDAYPMALCAHIFATVSLYVYLTLHDRRVEKRYLEMEMTIQAPVFYKTNGNFRVEAGAASGNIYFTDWGILFASLDEKPYRLQELPLANILKYEIDTIHLNIYTKDGQLFAITTPDASKVFEALTEKGWIRT